MRGEAMNGPRLHSLAMRLGPVLAGCLFALAAAGVARADPLVAGGPAERGLAAGGPAIVQLGRLRDLARRHAAEQGIAYELVDAVMWVESRYRPGARGGAGEIGLMQVMPPTARLLGFSGTAAELAEPDTNIRLGTRYLAEAWRLAGGDLCTAVMKYRAGHAETRFSVRSVAYCRQVRGHLAGLGFPVAGVVPEATFGFGGDVFRMGVAIGTQQAARRLASGRRLRSRVGWSAYDRRMKSLQAAGRASTAILR